MTMEDETVVDETSEVQEEVETPETPTTEEKPVLSEEELANLRKQAELAKNYKIRAEKAEADKKALEKKVGIANPALAVEDFLDISTALDGLEPREKEYLAKQHKLTGRPLNELRQDEDFTLWQSAYRDKVEKERLSMKPSTTQPESEMPKTFLEKLATADLAEKEKLLEENGYWKNPRPRADRSNIGPKGLR